jgi:hypothetical protein
MMHFLWFIFLFLVYGPALLDSRKEIYFALSWCCATNLFDT